MKKKIILSILTIVLLISLFTISIFIKNIKTQSYTVGKIITELDHIELLNCNYNYNYFSINIKIDNSNNNENISFKIYDPKEVLLDEIKVEKNDSINYSNDFDGIKGDYKVVFSQNNGIPNYNFTIDTYGKNQ